MSELTKYYCNSKFVSDVDEGWGEAAVYYAVDVDETLMELAEKIKRLEHECKGRTIEMRDAEDYAGRALGYPKYCDDQKNFPGATEADGVCIGDHATSTVVQELAVGYVGLKAECERMRIDEREILEEIDRKAQAGLCYFTLESARGFLKDIRAHIAAHLTKEQP